MNELFKPQIQPCAGRSCGSTNPNLHSAECFEDYEKTTGMAQQQEPVAQQAAGYVAVCEVLEQVGIGALSRAPSKLQIEEMCNAVRTLYTSPQQAQQEPVAWQVMVEDEAMKEFPIKDMAHDWCVHQKLLGSSYAYWIRPLYTTPPQRKPLTHEQRFDLLTKFEPHKNKWEAPAILIDMVEAAHGIKENT